MRVLVIDDEDTLRTMIRRILEPAGHHVTEAENGSVGLAEFHKHPFDVVLTDIMMPEKEGLETLIEMRSTNRSVRIVVMSGSGRIQNLDFLGMARRLGADATLEKPFRREELLASIEGRALGTSL